MDPEKNRPEIQKCDPKTHQKEIPEKALIQGSFSNKIYLED